MGKGGGGSGQQSTSTSYQTNIPQYAQPYVENMLGATQRQLFNTRDVAATPGSQTQSGVDDQGNPTYSTTPGTPGYTELTGFKQYQPYSSNPSDYVAGFSPLQQQGFSSIADMQIAPQIAMGTDWANKGAQGGINSAPVAYNYGAQGSQAGQMGQGIGTQGGLGYGSQASGLAGANIGIGAAGMGAGMGYGQAAQNPNAVRGYMNPYLQASLQPQLQEIQRQYGISGTQQQSDATRAGAFGGSREALMAAENQRNKNIAMNQVIGQGYNTAYDVANRNMQAASQLGMQGAQSGLAGLQGANQSYATGLQGVNTALAGTAQGMQGAQTGLAGVQGAQAGYGLSIQGANALNALANTQYNQQMGIAQAQLGAGAQQQGQQQQIINQGVQDYANAQQYPLMQLGTMSNMLRGLPMQAATTNQYMAAPNQLTQGIGAAGSLAYMNSAMNRGYAEGGITQAFDVGGEVEADLKNMSMQQLQQYMQESASPQAKRMAQSIIREKMIEEQLQKQQPQMQPQQFAKGGITEVQRFQNGPPAGEAVSSDKNRALLQALGFSDKNGIPINQVNQQPISTPVDGSSAVVTPAPSSQETIGPQGLPANIVSPTIDPELQRRENSYPEVMPRTLAPVTVTAPPEEEAPAAPTGIMQAGVSASDKQLLGEPPRQYRDRDEAMAELLAEKEKYGLTTNKGAEEFRTRAMSERANLKDEAERQRSMRMAEFFASWGSTPGNTLVAGMSALKNKIPDMIADDREQAKARKEADKILFEIDQAIRAEKLGDFAEAGKIKEKAADRAEKFNEKLLMLQMTRETNASRVAAAGASALTKQEQLRMQQDRINDNVYSSAMRDYKGAKDKTADIFKETQVATAKMVLDTLKPTSPENKAKIEAARNIYNAALERSTNVLRPYVSGIVRAGAAKDVEHNPDEFLYPYGRPASGASNFNGFRIVSQE